MTDVLHALRCMGFTTVGRLAGALGRPEAALESELIDLAVAGLVTRDSGAWGLTGAGRAADTERTAAELAAAGTRGGIEAAYEDFLVLNPELLDLCAAWQTRPGERVLGLFGDLHGRADTVCAALSSALPRFARYRTRLADALGRARAGEVEYLTDSMDSYHAVWFQLHEDLLVTLGLPRHS